MKYILLLALGLVARVQADVVIVDNDDKVFYVMWREAGVTYSKTCESLPLPEVGKPRTCAGETREWPSSDDRRLIEQTLEIAKDAPTLSEISVSLESLRTRLQRERFLDDSKIKSDISKQEALQKNRLKIASIEAALEDPESELELDYLQDRFAAALVRLPSQRANAATGKSARFTRYRLHLAEGGNYLGRTKDGRTLVWNTESHSPNVVQVGGMYFYDFADPESYHDFFETKGLSPFIDKDGIPRWLVSWLPSHFPYYTSKVFPDKAEALAYMRANPGLAYVSILSDVVRNPSVFAVSDATKSDSEPILFLKRGEPLPNKLGVTKVKQGEAPVAWMVQWSHKGVREVTFVSSRMGAEHFIKNNPDYYFGAKQDF